MFDFDLSNVLILTFKVLAVSRTRSGRMSRPPTQLEDDEYQYNRVVVTSSGALPPPSRADGTDGPDPQKQLSVTPLKPKRKLSVPARYRCRVCHKTYLGKISEYHSKYFETLVYLRREKKS